MDSGKVNTFLGKGYKSEKLVTSLTNVKTKLVQVQTNKGMTVNMMRKEIAQYLADGMEERARTKVLSVIREEKLIHAMDSLQYHCDVVIQHTALLAKKHLDPNLVENVSTLIYAAPRLETEVTEFKMVSDQLYYKYGKEFCKMCILNQTGNVNQLIVEKLSTDHPAKEQVDKYLSDIAKKMTDADIYSPNDHYDIPKPYICIRPRPLGPSVSADDIYTQYEGTYEVNARRSMAGPPTPNTADDDIYSTYSQDEGTYEVNARRSMAGPPTPNTADDDVYSPYSQDEETNVLPARENRRSMAVPPTPNIPEPNVHPQPAPPRPPKTETYEVNSRRSMASPPTPNTTFPGRTYVNIPPTTSDPGTNPANTNPNASEPMENYYDRFISSHLLANNMPGNVQAEPTNENAPVQPPELRTIPILIGEDSIPSNTKELYLLAVVRSPEEIYNMYSDQNPPPIPPRIPNSSSTDDVKSSTYGSSGSDYQRWIQHLVKVVPITKPLFEDKITNKSEGDASNTEAGPILRHAHFFNL
ncbi:uncharacterized protein [Phyllobates terribilis]|uniref:uncharacterized protein isoform X2 n=1 Tax=Phyllobates terribilis TaxID=111132 RepID=UPI003CCB509D